MHDIFRGRLVKDGEYDISDDGTRRAGNGCIDHLQAIGLAVHGGDKGNAGGEQLLLAAKTQRPAHKGPVGVIDALALCVAHGHKIQIFNGLDIDIQIVVEVFLIVPERKGFCHDR